MVTEHSIDTVQYELSVRRERDEFFGAFFCKRCHEGWVGYDPRMPTADDALKDAKDRAAIHHKVLRSASRN